VALFRAAKIPPVAAGFKIEKAVSLHAEEQTAGGMNYTLWAPEGDSCIGPLVAKDETTATITARAISGQSADLQQWQDSTGAPVARVTASGAIKTCAVDSGSRPSAISEGVGAQVYDTTLSKPLWSDGFVWRDAMGTAV
jgi:hypothetical protein